MRFLFTKAERLHQKKLIKELFNRGSSFYLAPFKIITMPLEAGDKHQILISIPKRNFKKAVDRNKLKRRVREAYRLNKHSIDSVVPLAISYIYTSKVILDFHSIESSMIQVLDRISSTSSS